MILNLSALIVFTSSLINLSTAFPQETKVADDLELARAKFHDLALGSAPIFELTPSNFSDLSLHKKRDIQVLPSTTFYVCSEKLLSGRCEKLASKRGFCCKCTFFLLVLMYFRAHTTKPFPSHGIIAPPPPPFFFLCVCVYARCNIEQ